MGRLPHSPCKNESVQQTSALLSTAHPVKQAPPMMRSCSPSERCSWSLHIKVRKSGTTGHQWSPTHLLRLLRCWRAPSCQAPPRRPPLRRCSYLEVVPWTHRCRHLQLRHLCPKCDCGAARVTQQRPLVLGCRVGKAGRKVCVDNGSCKCPDSLASIGVGLQGGEGRDERLCGAQAHANALTHWRPLV